MNLVQSASRAPGSPPHHPAGTTPSLALRWSSAGVHTAHRQPLSPPPGFQSWLCHFLGTRLGVSQPLWSHARPGNWPSLGLPHGGADGSCCLNPRGYSRGQNSSPDCDQCSLKLGVQEVRGHRSTCLATPGNVPLARGFPDAENRPLRRREAAHTSQVFASLA